MCARPACLAYLVQPLAQQGMRLHVKPCLPALPCSAIMEHPFLVQLVDGSLHEAVFKFYVVQGALYLR